MQLRDLLEELAMRQAYMERPKRNQLDEQQISNMRVKGSYFAARASCIFWMP